MIRSAAVVLSLALASIVPAPTRASAAESKEEAVRKVLGQREEAIRSGDKERFLDTVDPRASVDFRARQTRLFDGLRSVPLASFDLRLRTDEIPDLSTGLAERYAADEVFLPPVEARYRIEGADSADAVDGFFYTFLRRDGRWRIVSDTDVEDLGLPSARNLWDFGPVAKTVSAHFTILFNPADRKRAESLLALAEEGYGRLGEVFNRPLPTQVVVVLPHNLDQLREMLQATFDLANFVAFASAAVDRDRDRGWASTVARVYVQDTNLSRNRRAFQLETFHHELTHVAAFPLAGPFVPSWVHEGVADWMATGRRGPSPVQADAPHLPEDYEFTTGGGELILTAYEESTSAIAFLAKAKGRTAPLDLLAKVGETRIAPGTSDYHVDQGLRAVYGAGMAEFEKAWNGGR
jgi:hypothetical protein